MLRIHFTAQDFARTRLPPRPAPLVELKLTLMMLRRGDTEPLFGRWRRDLRRRLPVTTRPLWDLVSAFLGPAFVDPVSQTLAEGLDVVRGTPAALVRSGVARVYAERSHPPSAWVRALLQDEPDAWALLCRALDQAHSTVLGDSWPTVETWHRAEFARHALVTAEHGLGAALVALSPGSRLSDGVWEIDAPYTRRIQLEGRGLVLLPTFHWTGLPMCADQPEQPVLMAYPAGPGLPLRPPGGTGDQLGAVLGRTRAELLRLLEEEHSTSEVARLAGISVATASGQASALRAAGLIDSVRDGRTVLHRQTPLGALLATTNGAPPPPPAD